MISFPILSTKLFSPQLKPGHVYRPELIKTLNHALDGQLVLISASAGFGKTALVSEWVTECRLPSVWFVIDQSDDFFPRFVSYFITALQSIDPDIGLTVLAALQSPQPPSVESIFTVLINEIANIEEEFLFICDDYHNINSPEIDQALSYLIVNLPERMHFVILTREDPSFPLGRLRAREQLLEIRSNDLRFNNEEAGTFLTQGMGLPLSKEEIATLGAVTEGWITGLQLAAIALKSHQDKRAFIHSFSGNHHYIMDYLMQEVLSSQSEKVQRFLLQISILDRVCGSLCDALVPSEGGESGTVILEELQRMNLFITALDHIREWYRFHNFFNDFLRQRLKVSGMDSITLHERAGLWLEEHDFIIEAFQHYTAARNIDAAARLISQNINLSHMPGFALMIIKWMKSLPEEELLSRPDLLMLNSCYLLASGQVAGVETMLDISEKKFDESTTDHILIGRLAIAQATLALTHYNLDAVKTQSKRALQFLPKENLSFRSAAIWMLGMVYFFQKDFISARKTFEESFSIARFCGNYFIAILSLISLGQIQEAEHHFYKAVESYKKALTLSGLPSQPVLSEAHLGLGRIHYEWNELNAAFKHTQQALQLAHQYDRDIDRFLFCEIFMARLKRIRGDVDQARAILHELNRTVQHTAFEMRKGDVAGEYILLLLEREEFAEAEVLAKTYSLTILEARISLERNNPEKTLSLLDHLLTQKQKIIVPHESLEIKILQMLAYYKNGKTQDALELLQEIMIPARDGGFVRTFLDQGALMEDLLMEASRQKGVLEYIYILLEAFKEEKRRNKNHSSGSSHSQIQRLIDPLSPRELQVLQLIAEGNSNQEISTCLSLALDTVKGHNRNIFQKLDVENRIQAINAARNLQIIP